MLNRAKAEKVEKEKLLEERAVEAIPSEVEAEPELVGVGAEAVTARGAIAGIATTVAAFFGLSGIASAAPILTSLNEIGGNVASSGMLPIVVLAIPAVYVMAKLGDWMGAGEEAVSTETIRQMLEDGKIDEVAALGERAVDSLVDIYHGSGDPDIRTGAIKTLGEMGSDAKDAIPVLIEAFKDKELFSETASNAILNMGNDASPKLIEALKDSDPQITMGAEYILRRIGKETAPALIEALKDEQDPNVKLAIIQLITGMDINTKGFVPALIGDLNDGDRYVRERVDETLRRIGEPAVPALIEALKDEDSVNGAIRTLGKIGPVTEEVLPALIDTLKDEDEGVRRMAISALEEIGPDAKDAVPALIKALKDENPINGAIAASTLGKIGEPAVPDLIEALKDKRISQDITRILLYIEEFTAGDIVSNNNWVSFAENLLKLSGSEKSFDFNKIKSNDKRIILLENLIKVHSIGVGNKGKLLDIVIEKTNMEALSILSPVLFMIQNGHLDNNEAQEILNSKDYAKSFSDKAKNKILDLYDIKLDKTSDEFEAALSNVDFVNDLLQFRSAYGDNEYALSRLSTLLESYALSGEQELWNEKFNQERFESDLGKRQVEDEDVLSNLKQFNQFAVQVSETDTSDIFLEYFNSIISEAEQHKQQFESAKPSVSVNDDVEGSLIRNILEISKSIGISIDQAELTLEEIESLKQRIDDQSKDFNKKEKGLANGLKAQLDILSPLLSNSDQISNSLSDASEILIAVKNLEGQSESEQLSILDKIKSDYNLEQIKNDLLTLKKASKKSEAQNYIQDLISMIDNIGNAKVNVVTETVTAKIITSFPEALHIGYFGPGGSSEGNCQRSDRTSEHSQSLMGFIGDSTQFLIGLYDSSGNMIGFKTLHGLYEGDNLIFVFNNDKLYTQDVGLTSQQNKAAQELLQEFMRKSNIEVYNQGDDIHELTSPISYVKYYVDALGPQLDRTGAKREFSLTELEKTSIGTNTRIIDLIETVEAKPTEAIQKVESMTRSEEHTSELQSH